MTIENRTIEASNEREPIVGLPAWTYRNPELLRLEYERLILGSWQFVCHVNEVRAPGDYATLDLMTDSIIVMRGRDEELRAFQNVCRHRASRLLDGKGQCKNTIMCPYHGWVYGLDGRLASVPQGSTFGGLDKSEYGLNQVELEIFLGLVFVRVKGEGPSLSEIWGDYKDLIAPYGIDEMVPAGETTTQVWNCNWKAAVDNNLENYHVAVGHPGYHRMLDNDLMGFMNAHGVAGSQSVIKKSPSRNWAERSYQQLAPDAFAALPADIRDKWLFFSLPPNIGLDIYPDSFDIFQILPLSADSCLMRYPIFKRRNETRELRAVRYLNGRINRQVGVEDKELSERVQQGMMAIGYQPGPLSDIELSVHDLHNRVRDAIPAARLTEEPAPGTLAAVDAMIRASQPG